MILETKRLILRELNETDFDALYAVLGDPDIAEHYPYTFDEARVKDWIARNTARYETHGFGLWAVILKENGELVGDCGITLQNIHGQTLPEIGYHIRKDHQRKGYASEAAAACIGYAFESLGFPRVYSYMKYTNIPSQKTAMKNGMTFLEEYPDPANTVTKVYGISAEEWEKTACEQKEYRLIRVLRKEELTAALFQDFRRHQVVTKQWENREGSWCITEKPFVDDWGEKEYALLCRCLQNTLSTGGVVFGAFLHGRLKGFASVESKFFGSCGQYLDLSCIHVSEDQRRSGIGRNLMEQAKAWAKEKGGSKLFISAHPAVESQAFYKAMGCVDTVEFSPAHAEMEPADRQLELLL